MQNILGRTFVICRSFKKWNVVYRVVSGIPEISDLNERNQWKAWEAYIGPCKTSIMELFCKHG